MSNSRNPDFDAPTEPAPKYNAKLISEEAELTPEDIHRMLNDDIQAEQNNVDKALRSVFTQELKVYLYETTLTPELKASPKYIFNTMLVDKGKVRFVESSFDAMVELLTLDPDLREEVLDSLFKLDQSSTYDDFTSIMQQLALKSVGIIGGLISEVYKGRIDNGRVSRVMQNLLSIEKRHLLTASFVYQGLGVIFDGEEAPSNNILELFIATWNRIKSKELQKAIELES